MSVLDKKLVRDLSGLKGQVITIALVVACGIASYVTMLSAYDSLVYSRDRYYEHQRFADVFAHLTRAPESVAARLERIPGVAGVETRVTEAVLLPMPDMARPASGVVVSLPAQGEPKYNAVYVKEGRQLDPLRSDEALLLESFAAAHGIRAGDRLSVVINGTLRELSVVGIAMSPEYIFTLPPGGMAFDPKRMAVVWMNRNTAAAAFRMEGAFNDVLLKLRPGASERAVLSDVDRILEPYGGLSAVGRAKQPSNYTLNGELEQLENMATVVPFIFLFVAAFLLNVVLSRLIHLQRSQIATLKAVGYSDGAVGFHYLKLVSLIVVIGAALGIGAGAWLGRAMTDMYTGAYFKFPEPEFRLEPRVALVGVLVSLVAALVGALGTAWRVAQLPPAEAMRPPSPANYRVTLLERVGLFKILSPESRMVVREVQRRPLRLLMSTVGISLAVGIVIISGFFYDAIDEMLNVQMHEAMREDVTVTFVKPLPERAIRELEHLPGVSHAEGLRSVPVRFRAGHRWRDSVINGYPEQLELRRLLDMHRQRKSPPPNGVMLTKKLAEILDVRVGELVEVELFEGKRGKYQLVVAGVIEESFGLFGHMQKAQLARLLQEGSMVNTGLLRADPRQHDEIYRRLAHMPWVSGVSSPRDFREQFEGLSGAIMRTYTVILTLFASIIAIGVVYNNARVALSQRNRDLASLRVLGFSRAEIARILFGEIVIQVALAIPLGLLVGNLMAHAMARNMDPEVYRMPVILSTRTYAYAACVAIASAVVSALLVRRKLDKLDLIGVLKTRE